MPSAALLTAPSLTLAQLVDTLKSLGPVEALYPEHAVADCLIKGVCSDSREVKPGFIFVALVGTAQGGGSNGHHYMNFAIETQQASAVVIQADQLETVRERVPEAILRQVPVFVVSNTYAAVSQMSSALHGWPGHQLTLYGVITHTHETDDLLNLNKHQALFTLLSQTLAQHTQQPVGQIGLNGFRIAETNSTRHSFATRPVGHIPPWTEELQPLMAQMLSKKCQQAFLALNPQGMAQQRYLGCRLHTMLSLSEHFQPFVWEERVLPVITPHPVQMTRRSYRNQGILTTLQVDGHPPIEALFPFLDADLLQMARLCIAMLLTLRPDLPLEVMVNSLSGLDSAALWEPWCSLHWLERQHVSLPPQQAHVLVDSASSPVQVKASMQTVRNMMQDGVFARTQPDTGLSPAKLWVVTGAPGDHHPQWRKPLAIVLAEDADRIVLTSDNPRNERVEAINAEIIAALPEKFARNRVISTTDRAKGIRYALTQAQPQDVVLVCGKGRRFTYQILPDGVYPWEDEVCVNQAIVSS